MEDYNSAFFNSISTAFLIYREKNGEEEALKFLRELFSTRLKEVYDSLGFQGGTQDFVRVVGENDSKLGLRVEFKVSGSTVIYRFLFDPFPNLKGKVDWRRFDPTYMDFKVGYLLGEGWSYKTTKHLWDGDQFTEHVISRK